MQEASSELMVCTTAFNPERHGFHFTNVFKWKPSVLGIRLGSWKLGFCGGMCAGALYRFKNKIKPPPDTVPPEDGAILFKEIFSRQRTSIPIPLILKVYSLQCTPDQSHWFMKRSLAYRTKREWPGLQKQLDAGIPAAIVLIQVRGCFGNMTGNHQVLATGYEYDQSTKALMIHIYDPNFPDKISHLTINPDPANNSLNASDSSGDCLRGFFVNPYTDRAAS
jgi:hypothetical protein